MTKEKDPRAERRGGERSGHLNIRFSETARWILDELQENLGLSQASVIEMLLREESRRRGFIVPGSGADKARKEALAQEARRLGIKRDDGRDL